MSAVAFRAGEFLTEDKLKAHLALLLRVENLGTLFGSGTSISAGGKQMSQIWIDFGANYPLSFEVLKDKKLVDQNGPPLGNFESLIAKIDLAVEFYTQVEPNAEAVKAYRGVRRDLLLSVLDGVKLEKQFWTGDFSSAPPNHSISDYQKFLIRFCANRQPGQPNPWLFTLNYDLGVEWAAESLGITVNNGFKGVHFRKFDPSVFDLGQRNVMSTGQAQFSVHGINYVKLHGSLSWQIDGKGNLREMPSEAAINALTAFSTTPTVEFPCQVIIPSTAKFSQTVGYVYGEMIRRFHEFACKEQAVLLLSGYSFGDDHINRILASALENPTLQLVVFYPEFDGKAASLKAAQLLRLAFENQLPNVTIIGGGSSAYFGQVASLLPVPAIFDQRRDELKSMIRALDSGPQTPPDAPPAAAPIEAAQAPSEDPFADFDDLLGPEAEAI